MTHTTPPVDWALLWHAAGHHLLCTPASCSEAGVSNPDYDAAADWAVDSLANAGYRPDGPDADAVDVAQAHLILAALACPAVAR
jgi:hypothetical protein